MRAGLLGCFVGVKIKLSAEPPLRATGATARKLKACFASRRSEGKHLLDYMSLDEILEVVPEPSDPSRVIDVSRGEIFGIPWWITTGNSLVGQAGDVFVLKEDDCQDVVRSASQATKALRVIELLILLTHV